MEKIAPRIDIAFKKIFGVEENKDLLMSLINSIVSEEDEVEDITLLNPYNSQNFRNEKMSILDIKAKGPTGKRFNIEIQITDQSDYDKRALYYWAKLYTDQLEQGAGYSQLNKAIGIHILNFTSIPFIQKYHNIFDLREREEGFHYFKDIELHTIELSKFIGERLSADNKHLSKSEELNRLLPDIKTSLDRWATFLTRHHLLDRSKLPKELNDVKLEKALEVLEVMNFTKEEREAYEDHLKFIRTEASSLNKRFAEGLEEGEAIGIQKGLEQGIQKGIEEGIQKGIEEGRQEEQKKMAINMLRKNADKEFIADVTGLSLEVINKLANDI